MKKEIKKEYSNGEITIVWQPAKCIHAGICVKTLPNVYDPNAKPWIKIEQADTDELKKQIDNCPSGALSYYVNTKEERNGIDATTEVEILENGPLIVRGDLSVKNIDGKIETKNKTTAFCRCGASLNKPYCDGAHRKIGFQD